MTELQMWEDLSPSKPIQNQNSKEELKSFVSLDHIIRQTMRDSLKPFPSTLDSKAIFELIQGKNPSNESESEIILSEGIDKPDREAVMAKLVIFFFGLSTNTVVISENKEGESIMCITNSFLTVMKNASISGKKGVFQELQFAPRQFGSASNCAKVLSKWLRIVDLSLEQNKKACISLDYYFEQCRILNLSYKADLEKGIAAFAKLQPDWLNNMEEIVDSSKVRMMPSGGRLPFKSTKFTDPVEVILGVGIVDSDTYRIIQRSKYYNHNNGLLQFFQFGTISPQSIPVIDGDLIKFEGLWRFTNKVNVIPNLPRQVDKSRKRKIDDLTRSTELGKDLRSTDGALFCETKTTSLLISSNLDNPFMMSPGEVSRKEKKDKSKRRKDISKKEKKDKSKKKKKKKKRLRKVVDDDDDDEQVPEEEEQVLENEETDYGSDSDDSKNDV